MEVKILKEEENKLFFVLSKANPAYANTLRRVMLTEVPVLAIKNVTFAKNSSALFDEILAHRLGLLPLETSLDDFELPSRCSCEGAGCAKCQVKMSLNCEGPLTVYASDLKCNDPKVKPVKGKMPIVTLLKGQELEFEANITLGIGKEHAKYSPGLIHYRGYPNFVANKASNLKECADKLKDVLELNGKELIIKDFGLWKESYEELCEEFGVQIVNSDTDFVFIIESWMQLSPREILLRGLEALESKLEEVKTLAK